MYRSKQLAAIFGFRIINGVEDSRVGGEHDAGVPVILVGTQIAEGHIRQIPLKVILRLLDQRGAVSQEKNIRNPLAADAYEILVRSDRKQPVWPLFGSSDL